MLTYQDYLEVADGKIAEFVRQVIKEHKESHDYKTAQTADEYDAERNPTIREFVRTIFTSAGASVVDETVSNMKLTSNYFARLNTQRCTYSLGNGLTFQTEGIMERLGGGADKAIKDGGYFGLIHGVSFLYWAYDHIHIFKLTEFAPLWDEETSNLGAGVRFWQLADDKPLHATLYIPDGYVEFRSKGGNLSELEAVGGNVHAYRMTVDTTPATTGEVETAHNYSSLPIVPLWGSRLKQSTLLGMRSKIDAYDIVQSGFANDMQDCAQIYWIVSGAGGATENELSKFRERLLYRHIAQIDGDNISITPHTQEIPYSAREALLSRIKAQLYEDFGGLDVHTIAAGATNDHIDAAYQPMDENADDFEYQIIEAVQKLLALQGVSPEEATPQFKRNRISNQREQVEMVMLEAPYLDDETILSKLPNISNEEVESIMKKKAAEDIDRLSAEVTEVIEYGA